MVVFISEHLTSIFNFKSYIVNEHFEKRTEGGALRGVCVNAERADLMETGEIFYLFPNGPDHVYVSRFDNPGAHFGCFERARFKELEAEAQEEAWPPEPPAILPELDQERLYRARLIWRKPFYKGKELGVYYVSPLQTSGFFYRDPERLQFCGCFPLHWFADFSAVETVTEEPETVIEEAEVIAEELPAAEWEQLNLFSI
jgi:hypothetical protein